MENPTFDLKKKLVLLGVALNELNELVVKLIAENITPDELNEIKKWGDSKFLGGLNKEIPDAKIICAFCGGEIEDEKVVLSIENTDGKIKQSFYHSMCLVSMQSGAKPVNDKLNK